MPLIPTNVFIVDFIKFLLLSVAISFTFLYIDSFYLVDFFIYLLEDRGIVKFSIGVFLYAGLTLSTSAFLLSRQGYIRVLAFLFLFLAISTQYGYKQVNGYGFTYFDANTMLSEIGLANQALLNFLPLIYKSLIVILILCVLGYFAVGKFYKKLHIKYAILPMVFFFALGFYVVRETAGAQVFPTMLKIPTLLTFASSYSTYDGPRDELKAHSEQASQYKHIIYIVDESVRADYLSINDPTNPTTPYLHSISDKLRNYGITSAGANNSMSANFILRTGSGAKTFPDEEQRSLKQPTIFQFAQNAGFKTIFMDGQKGELQNMMREKDLDFMDHILQIEENSMPKPDIDYKLADELLSIINHSDSSTFSYIVKFGVHFHYENCYPENQRIHTPTMEYGSMITDSIKMRNSYKNAIRWSVDEWFKYFLPQLPDSTLLVYTSDHGQTLMEHGIKSTHFDLINPSPLQAMVPLFFYCTDSASYANFNYLDENINRVSHFNIFPSLVKIMGYSDSVVSTFNHSTIFEPLDEERIFYSGKFFPNANHYKNNFDSKEIQAIINKLSPSAQFGSNEAQPSKNAY